MNKVNDSDWTLVGPSTPENLSYQIIQDALSKSGLGDESWLVDVLLRDDCLGDVDRGQLKEYADAYLDDPGLRQTLSGAPNRATRLILFAGSLLGLSPPYGPARASVLPEEGGEVPTWLTKYKENACRLGPGFDWSSIQDQSIQNEFRDFLVPYLLDWEEIIRDPTGKPDFDGGRRRWTEDKLEHWLDRWFNGNGPAVDFRFIVLILEEQSDTEVGQGVLNVLEKVENVLGASQFGAAWEGLRSQVNRLHRLLESREPEDRNNRSLTTAWWKASALLYEAHLGGQEVSDELRQRLVASTRAAMGAMRFELRESPADVEFNHYQWAVSLLKEFESPWETVRLLLLAFSEMAEASVCPDLRYWPESPLPAPPSPFSLIPTWIATSLYSDHLGAEIAADPALRGFRTKFAKFCLSRLKTRRSETKESGQASDLTNEAFVEPRACWRACYAKAIQELEINPGGRGHKSLLWLSDNDPDPRVRKAAREAYKSSRRRDASGLKPQSGVSPRRPLFAAFWWLRQAHLINLGVDIDARGADRTRDKEIRRTKERED